MSEVFESDPAQRVVEHVRNSSARAEALQIELDNQAAIKQQAISTLASRVRQLEEQLSKSSSTRNDLLNRENNILSESRELRERAETAEAARDDVAARLRVAEAQKASDDEALARAAQHSADQAKMLASARAQIADLASFRNSAEDRIKAAEESNLALARDGAQQVHDSDVAQQRIKFLEGERMRAAQEIAETRSRLDVAANIHGKETEQLRSRIGLLEREVEEISKHRRADTEEMTNLRVALSDLQREKERIRTDSRKEVEALTTQVETHRDAARDAEKQVEAYRAEVDEIIRTTKQHEEKVARNPTDGATLSAHAEALLKHTQQVINDRADDLDEKWKEFDAAKAQQIKLVMETERLRREKETLSAALEDVNRKARRSATRIEDLERRNYDLERQILRAGDLAKYRPDMWQPDHTRNIPYGITRRVADGDVTIEENENDFMSPGTAAEDLNMISRQHNDIIESLRAHRNMYPRTAG